MTDDQVRKLADQILRMRRFVASQEATIRVKVEELAEALGRSIEDTEALLRASESAGKSDMSGIHPTRTPPEVAIVDPGRSQSP